MSDVTSRAPGEASASGGLARSPDPGGAATHRLEQAGWLALLLALPLAKHWGVSIGSAAFAGGDHTWINLPLRAVSRDAFRAGCVPLWDKALSCGTPHLAQGEAGVFYPGNLLLYVLPDVVRAYGWTVLLHHVLLGWTTYALLRSYLVRPRIAFLFAALSVLSPYALLNMPTSNFFQTFWLVPAIFLCLKLAQSGRPARAGLLGGVLLGVHLTVGRPELAVYGWATVGVVAAVHATLSADRRMAVRRAAVFLAVAGALGIALGAIQILPTLEFLGASSRAASEGGRLAAYGAWLRPDRLYTLFLFPCFPLRSGLHTAYSSGNPYVGLAPAGLVLAALADSIGGWRDRRAWLGALRARGEVVSLAAGSAFALLLAVGPTVPLLRAAWAVPPLSLLRFPGRSLPVFLCLFYVLAALAWEHRLRDRGPSRGAVALAAGILAAGTLGFALRSGDTVAPAIPLLNLLLQAVPLLVVLAWPALRQRRAWREGAVAAACLVQIAPLLLFYANPTLPRPEFDREFEPLATVGKAPAGDRRTVVMGFRRPGPARPTLGGRAGSGPPEPSANPPSLGDAGLLVGADVVNEYNQFAIGPWREFLQRTLFRETTGAAPYPPEPPVCDLIGIRWLYLDRDVEIDDPGWEPIDSAAADALGTRLWRRRAGVPNAALLGETVRATATGGASLAETLLRNPPDLRRQILLSASDAPDLPKTEGKAAGEVREEDAGPNAYRFQVRAERRQYLLLRDQDYPGWEAYLDGRPTACYRANGFFKAVVVPEGEHEVLFRFEPASFRLGAGLSLAAASVALAAALAGAWRSARRRA